MFLYKLAVLTFALRVDVTDWRLGTARQLPVGPAVRMSTRHAVPWRKHFTEDRIPACTTRSRGSQWSKYNIMLHARLPSPSNMGLPMSDKG